MHNRGLYVRTEKEATIDILMVALDGNIERRCGIVPATDLIQTLDIDYTPYRRAVRKLRDEHSLLEEKLDISVSEYRDFLSTAFRLPAMLQTFDPVGSFVVASRLELIAQIPDDGSAAYLMYQGQRIIEALLEPVTVQIQLRNIFEVAFGRTERKTQRERFLRLTEAYPQLFDHYTGVRRIPAEGGNMPFSDAVEYAVNSLLELRLLELELFFRQDKRIARCAHCWNYFQPKTKKETLYCDREKENCKQLGPIAQRRISQHHDNALEFYEVLRHRMEARYDRFINCKEIPNTDYPIDLDIYCDWSDAARQSRLNYLDGKIGAEEFIRRIDLYDELTDFISQRTEPFTGESKFEQHVKRDLRFDPEQHYFDIQALDLSSDNPQWEIVPASQWKRKEQGEQIGLAEKMREIENLGN